MSTFYDDLGLQANCSQDEIEKAYKKMALRYHPDRNPGDNEAAVIFLKIQQAYDILKDSNKRRDYDFSLNPINNNPWHHVVQEQENLDIKIFVDISFEESVTGVKKTIKYNKKFACHDCGANGFKKFTTCSICNGTGNLRNLIAGFFNFQTLCHACQGQGKLGHDKCTSCNGEKYIAQGETDMDVTFPPGIRQNMVLSVQGHGNIGRTGNIGNVFFQVNINESKKYSLKNLDIHFNFDVDFSTLIFGGKISIPTFENEEIEIEIPAKTQSLTTFRVKGKGMPSFNNNMLRGDLVATVVPKVPSKDFAPELLPVLKHHGI